MLQNRTYFVGLTLLLIMAVVIPDDILGMQECGVDKELPEEPFHKRLDVYLKKEIFCLSTNMVEQEFIVDSHIDQHLELFVGVECCVPEIKVFGPDEREINLEEDPQGLLSRREHAVFYRVSQPKSGKWRVCIQPPKDNKMQNCVFSAVGRGKDNVFLAVKAQALHPAAEQRAEDSRYAGFPDWFIHVAARFAGRYVYGIGNVDVTGEVTSPEGEKVLLVLCDDGLRSDQYAGDGTYSAVIPIDFSGTYLLRVDAAANNARTLEAKDVPDFFETGPPRNYKSEQLDPFTRTAFVTVEATETGELK